MNAAGHSRREDVQASARRRVRWLLIALILVAFARLLWRVDARSLWWDESLSLQRAESPLADLVPGHFVFDDGITQTRSFDQHPFGYFLVLGGLIRLAGQSDFVLRFPSVAAATLLVPAAWALARLLVRRRVLPSGAALWAALLAAANPFYLWYGREVRMYSLVPLLALVSSYLLLRGWSEDSRPAARRYLLGYLVTLLLLLGTHYLAVLILPAHALLVLARLAARSRRQAGLVVVGLLAGGALVAGGLARLILKSPGAGTNFAIVSLPVMVRDLLNAFSLGLSVDVSQVLWLDLVFAALAIVGIVWPLRRGRLTNPEAWFLPAFLLLPILLLQIIQWVQPAYMNARHLSLISGAFVLLVAGGIAAVWHIRRWAAVGLAALLLAGSANSTYNYYYAPDYNKDNFAAVGADLAAALQPGDGLVLVPTEMVRLYRHYLPLDLIARAVPADALAADEPHDAWQSLPQLGAPWEVTEARLAAMLGRHRRVWLVASGMVPLSPLQQEAREWLSANAFLVQDNAYESNTLLWLKLYLPQAPVLPALPATVQHPVTAVFGERVRLNSYDVGQPLSAASVTPVTLYWQPAQVMDRRYKYILRWTGADGAPLPAAGHTEREPYHGLLPTTLWGLGQTIVEYSDLPPLASEPAVTGEVRLALQVYDAETLEKLPLTEADPALVAADGQTLLLPYAP
jgi:mannosyltransferase